MNTIHLYVIHHCSKEISNCQPFTRAIDCIWLDICAVQCGYLISEKMRNSIRLPIKLIMRNAGKDQLTFVPKHCIRTRNPTENGFLWPVLNISKIF